MLHDRLVNISKTEWYGQYYLPPANCHFLNDEPDSVAGTSNINIYLREMDSEITLATTKYGGKDPGEDIDVFYIDMLQDVEYEVHIEGLDPTSEDARLALAELVISNASSHSISEIEPQMKVLDAEWQRVSHHGTARRDQDVHARRHSPILLRGTGTTAYVREYMSGLYKIEVNIAGEGAGDVGQTTTDAQPIQANTMITGSIGTAADADWFSFTSRRSQRSEHHRARRRRHQPRRVDQPRHGDL